MSPFPFYLSSLGAGAFLREGVKTFWEGVGSFPSLSLAFLSLAGFTLFLDSFAAAILKASRLVLYMVAAVAGFVGLAVLIPRSGWE